MDIIIVNLMKYAYDHKITVILTNHFDGHTPSASRPDTKTIVVNTNWHEEKEIPFQMAHELGHVVNGDEGTLYYSSFSNKSKYERAANMTGLDILIPIYVDATGYTFNNVSPFMEQFGIPNYLLNAVISRFKKCLNN